MSLSKWISNLGSALMMACDFPVNSSRAQAVLRGHSYQNSWPRVATVQTYMSFIAPPLTDVSTQKIFTGDNGSGLCILCCIEPGRKWMKRRLFL